MRVINFLGKIHLMIFKVLCLFFHAWTLQFIRHSLAVTGPRFPSVPRGGQASPSWLARDGGSERLQRLVLKVCCP